MLKSIIIRGFRLFSELQIKRLNRINLIIGKNNSGKSCLLEAIQVYASRGNPRVLHELISGRDEYWESPTTDSQNRRVEKLESPVKHLFHGYHLPEINKNGIEIGPIDRKKDRVTIQTKAYQISEDEEGRRRRIVIDEDREITELVDVEIGLQIKEGMKGSQLFPLPFDPRSPIYRRRPILEQEDEANIVQIVPTRNLEELKVALLWDRVNLTDLESEVISCLKIVESGIQGIALVGDTSSRYIGDTSSRYNRIPIIRC